jgi:ribonuclease-3
VLGLVVAERLFRAFADDEGRLTRARSDLVRRETLAQQAREIELGQCLLLGRGEVSSGGSEKDSILCDAFEALLGAVYCDGGLDAARAFIERVMADELSKRGDDGQIHSPRDPRTLLQEHMQAGGCGMPDYRIVGSDGPPHNPVWTVEVLRDSEVLGRGSGGSKQDAARMAAREAMGSLAGEGRGAG